MWKKHEQLLYHICKIYQWQILTENITISDNICHLKAKYYMVKCRQLSTATKIATVRLLKGEFIMTKKKRITAGVLSFVMILVLMGGVACGSYYDDEQGGPYTGIAPFTFKLPCGQDD